MLVKESHIQTYSRTSVCGRTYLGVVYRKDRRDRIFNPQLTAIKNSYNKVNVYCSNICYTRIRYEIFFVHTYVTYENKTWPNLCYTQKYDI